MYTIGAADMELMAEALRFDSKEDRRRAVLSYVCYVLSYVRNFIWFRPPSEHQRSGTFKMCAARLTGKYPLHDTRFI